MTRAVRGAGAGGGPGGPRPGSIVENTDTRRVTGRRLVVGLVGGVVLAVGIALLVLPGPAVLVIPAGLALLSMEFAWARRWLRRARGCVEGGAGRPGSRSGGRFRAALGRWWRRWMRRHPGISGRRNANS